MKKKKFAKNLTLTKRTVAGFNPNNLKGGFDDGTLLAGRCDSEDQCLSYYEVGDCNNNASRLNWCSVAPTCGQCGTGNITNANCVPMSTPLCHS